MSRTSTPLAAAAGIAPRASAAAGPAGISRRALLRGTAVTAAVALGGAASVLTAAPAMAAQGGWRWCNQCQGLWYGGNGPSNKPCPIGANRVHSSSGSGNYTLAQRPSDGADQWNWAWCQYCQGLWYTGNNTAGYCPARGAQGHSSQGSSNYGLIKPDVSLLPPPGQPGWAWCHRCQGLWYVHSPFIPGFCPAGGDHSITGSAVYSVLLN
jgi:hypothetical protein